VRLTSAGRKIEKEVETRKAATLVEVDHVGRQRHSGHFHERSSVTVTISMTGRSCEPRFRARNIICPVVSRKISTSEDSPRGEVKAWRTFARTSVFKWTASSRFKADNPRESNDYCSVNISPEAARSPTTAYSCRAAAVSLSVVFSWARRTRSL